MIPVTNGISAMPDWPLGILFGLGGFIGMYLGAKTQKYVSQKVIKSIVSAALLFLAVNYIKQYFA